MCLGCKWIHLARKWAAGLDLGCCCGTCHHCALGLHIAYAEVMSCTANPKGAFPSIQDEWAPSASRQSPAQESWELVLQRPSCLQLSQGWQQPGMQEEGTRSLNIHHGPWKWGPACTGKHKFVCSLHPSDLSSITTPGAIWERGVVGEQDRPPSLVLSYRPHGTPQHPSLPRAASNPGS